VRAFLAISLPRLLWATGPLSLLVQIPLLARLQVAGQTGLASAAQAVTATAAAGVIVAGFLAPIQTPADGAPTKIERAAFRADAERARNFDPHHGAEAHDDGDHERTGNGGGGGGGGRNDGGTGEEPGTTTEPPSGEPSGTPAPDPSPTDPPTVKTSPTPPPPTTATVPDVVGMKADRATAVLQEAGFVVAAAKRWSTDKTQKNVVIAQSEPAGSELDLGSTVTITVMKWRPHA
jgi:hypothetical protein